MPSRFARDLRNHPTDAERRLWFHLRRRQLDAYRFRRQAPLGPYILDFFCPEARLAIEVDGGQHANRNAQDSLRSLWLGAHGIRVIRFWNNEVLTNTEGVLRMISLALKHPPP
jgi:very-short-patch-repair endonuclease